MRTPPTLTQFGKAVRKARIDVGVTLGAMAAALNVSSPYMNSIEKGKRFVSVLWVQRIEEFFRTQGHFIELGALADVSNQRVSLEGLSLEQQYLIARLAHTPLSEAQIAPFERLLQKIKEQ